MKKIVKALTVLGIGALALSGCSQADTASRNISRAADQFEIERRIVFFNGITDTYLLSIEGLCSMTADNLDSQLEVTCKTGPTEYRKHYLGLSDNVSYFSEQIEGADVDPYHYKVIFRPSTIIPDIDLDVK